MRILQICNKAPYPANDGSSIAIYNMSCGFIENNVALTLLTINTKKHFKPNHLVPSDFKSKSNYTSVYKNTNIKPIEAITNVFKKQSYFISRFYFEKFKLKLISILKNNQFDIIHLEGLFVASYFHIIKKHSKAKIVLRTHNIEHLIWERMIANEKNTLKKKYLQLQNNRLKKFELNILPLVDAIVTITAFDKHYFQQLGIKNNYFVSPTGIDLNKYPLKPEKEEKMSVFHFGSMDWMPNVEAVEWFIKEVWLKYFIDDINYTFCIAGRHIPKHIYQYQQKNIKILHNIEDQIEFYNSNQIMVVPLLSGSGMRIKILEGLAMAKPIISTSIGAEGIPVEHNKNIVIANTPQEFAHAIQNISHNNAYKTELQKNARIFISANFNNNKLVAKLLDFYSTLTK